MLRNKANFGVLEGFLTVLLGEPIRIVEILESEGNQQRENDKFNRVDIKARNIIYYGCERYPDCDFMTWDMPVPTKCPKCGSTMFRKGSKLYCAKEGCGYEMPVPKKD